MFFSLYPYPVSLNTKGTGDWYLDNLSFMKTKSIMKVYLENTFYKGQLNKLIKYDCVKFLSFIEEIGMKRGVRQGCFISPTWFIIIQLVC